MHVSCGFQQKMFNNVILFLLLYINYTTCISPHVHNQNIRSLLKLNNDRVHECKQSEFEHIQQAHGVTQCQIKNETFKFGDQLGTGSFGVVYDAISLQTGTKLAIKFVKNQFDTATLESIRQENTVMKTLKDANIPNVAAIEDPIDIDENAPLFVISMKQYYKDVKKFINQDVSKFRWNSLDLLKFVAKIGV